MSFCSTNHPQNDYSQSSNCEYSEAGLLNKSSRLALALVAAKFITIIAIYLVTLCCATKSDLNVQQTHLRAFI
jgi:hypothetical protein